MFLLVVAEHMVLNGLIKDAKSGIEASIADKTFVNRLRLKVVLRRDLPIRHLSFAHNRPVASEMHSITGVSLAVRDLQGARQRARVDVGTCFTLSLSL